MTHWHRFLVRLQVIGFLSFACSHLTVAQSSTKKDLIALENRFNEALVRADLKTIQGIEADDLIFTDAAGVVTSKADELQSIEAGDIKFQSIKMTDTRVQDFGNFGVVTGSLVEKAQYKGTDISGTYRFTDVWARRHGKWEHVAGQETLVPPTATDAKNPQLKGRTVSPSEIAYWQLYASADGETHFRKVIVALTEKQPAPPAPPYAESEPQPASTIRYAAFPAHWGMSDRDHSG